jgi:hypothetical protein
LRNFGLRVGVVGTVKFEPRIKEPVEELPDLAVLVEPLRSEMAALSVTTASEETPQIGACRKVEAMQSETQGH